MNITRAIWTFVSCDIGVHMHQKINMYSCWKELGTIRLLYSYPGCPNTVDSRLGQYMGHDQAIINNDIIF